MVPDDYLGAVIADVSGKGVGAAIFMALTRSLLRAYADQNHATPAEVLEAVARTNAYILRHHQHEAYMFATLFFGIINCRTGWVHHINAGHLPPILIRADGHIETLMPTGPLLGVTENIPFRIGTAFMNAGDTLLTYTDGITEAVSAGGEMFGLERLYATVGQPFTSAEAVLQAVMVAVRRHIGDADFSDDMTMLAVHRQA